MALIKGTDVQQQGQPMTQGGGEVDLSQYGDPEERRMVERGLIILKLRRYWRLFCFGWFVIAAVVSFVGCLYHGQGIGAALGSIALAAIGCLIWYVVFLYLFLYILIDKVLMFYFFVRDLFTKKDTKF